MKLKLVAGSTSLDLNDGTTYEWTGFARRDTAWTVQLVVQGSNWGAFSRAVHAFDLQDKRPPRGHPP